MQLLEHLQHMAHIIFLPNSAALDALTLGHQAGSMADGMELVIVCELPPSTLHLECQQPDTCPQRN